MRGVIDEKVKSRGKTFNLPWCWPTVNLRFFTRATAVSCSFLFRCSLVALIHEVALFPLLPLHWHRQTSNRFPGSRRCTTSAPSAITHHRQHSKNFWVHLYLLQLGANMDIGQLLGSGRTCIGDFNSLKCSGWESPLLLLSNNCCCFWCKYTKIRRKRHSYTCWCVNICDCTANTRHKKIEIPIEVLWYELLYPTSMSGVISQVLSWSVLSDMPPRNYDPLQLHYILCPCAPRTFCNWGRQLRLQYW